MINQKQANKLWKHLFKEKIPRLMDEIYALPNMESQLLLLKICFQVDKTIQEQLITAEDKRVTQFAQMFWPYLDDESFFKVRQKLDRIAKWYKRTGLADKIWREI